MKLDLTREVNYLILNMDEEEHKEIYNYLSTLVCEDESVEMEPYELATSIIRVNRGKQLSEFLFECIVALYEMAIDDGNDDAMNDLGVMYYDGYGVNQNFEKAFHYYNMAADKGNQKSQENLGYCYYYGRSVDVDYEKAYHYFILGALTGAVNSLYKIGDMYQNGYYVKKDLTEAFRIYEQCANLITEDDEKYVTGPVYLRIGNALLNGWGTKEDAGAALFCFQKAETFLIGMIQRGDIMYKKSLQQAIEGQSKARRKLAKTFPKEIWIDEK